MNRSKEVFTCVYIKALTEFFKVLETYSNEQDYRSACLCLFTSRSLSAIVVQSKRKITVAPLLLLPTLISRRVFPHFRFPLSAVRSPSSVFRVTLWRAIPLTVNSFMAYTLIVEAQQIYFYRCRAAFQTHNSIINLCYVPGFAPLPLLHHALFDTFAVIRWTMRALKKATQWEIQLPMGLNADQSSGVSGRIHQ